MLQTPEFWIGIFISFVVSILANLATPHAARMLSGNWLLAAIKVNVIAMPLLIIFGYSAFSAVWIFDSAQAVLLACGYVMLSVLNGPIFRLFALLAPNAVMLAAIVQAYRLGIPDPWMPLLSIYPLAFLFALAPMMGWTVVAMFRGQLPREG